MMNSNIILRRNGSYYIELVKDKLYLVHDIAPDSLKPCIYFIYILFQVDEEKYFQFIQEAISRVTKYFRFGVGMDSESVKVLLPLRKRTTSLLVAPKLIGLPTRCMGIAVNGSVWEWFNKFARCLISS